MKKIITENLSTIIEKYQQGNSLTSLSKEFNVNMQKIRKLLVEHGIQIRNHESSRRLYEVNHNYFDEINCQEKAYILGFLYADGNIGKNNNRIVLALQEDDREILEKINNYIQPNKPLYFIKKVKQKNTVKMQIHSANMRQKLIDLGCMPNKSRLIEFPKNIPEKFINSFIRGFMDGDGHVGPKYTHFIVPKSFLSGFFECIKKHLNIEFTAYESKHSPGFYNVFIGGRQRSIVFLKWLYKDAAIYLNRKFEKFQQQLVFERKPINFTKNKKPIPI